MLFLDRYSFHRTIDVEDNDSEDEDIVDTPAVNDSLSALMTSLWQKRRQKLDHDMAITAWALCISPEVIADCQERMTGHHRDAIERTVRKLHAVPGVNTCPGIEGMTVDEIVDEWWNEYKAFKNKTYPFDKPHIWNSIDVVERRTWIWMEKYALPYTKVLGFVGCRVTSKTLGIGPCERSWGALKSIKTGKRSAIKAESIEKRTILYTTALLNNARIDREQYEKMDCSDPQAAFCIDELK